MLYSHIYFTYFAVLNLYTYITYQPIALLLLFENCITIKKYGQVSNVRRTLVGIEIVDHSYVVGAPTTSSFST